MRICSVSGRPKGILPTVRRLGPRNIRTRPVAVSVYDALYNTLQKPLSWARWKRLMRSGQSSISPRAKNLLEGCPEILSNVPFYLPELAFRHHTTSRQSSDSSAIVMTTVSPDVASIPQDDPPPKKRVLPGSVAALTPADRLGTLAEYRRSYLCFHQHAETSVLDSADLQPVRLAFCLIGNFVQNRV
jgi:hypothetical protein